MAGTVQHSTRRPGTAGPDAPPASTFLMPLSDLAFAAALYSITRMRDRSVS